MPNLLALLKDGFCQDLTLVCQGGKQMEVHKNILGATSDVFRRMLEVDMKERRTGVIEIMDHDPAVVTELVNYLYSDQITPDFLHLADLLRIGHQYEVYSLVVECASRLVTEANVDNVVQLGTLAETYKLGELSERCVGIIAEKFEELDTDELDTLPSSLLRKVLSKTRRVSPAEGSDPPYTANFFTSLGTPATGIQYSPITTWFTVNSPTTMSGVGMYFCGDNVPVEMGLAKWNSDEIGWRTITNTSTRLTSSNITKVVKVMFQTPGNIQPGDDHRVVIKFGNECGYCKGDGIKSPVSVRMGSGEEVKVYVVSGGRVEIPIFYFTD